MGLQHATTHRCIVFPGLGSPPPRPAHAIHPAPTFVLVASSLVSADKNLVPADKNLEATKAKVGAG